MPTICHLSVDEIIVEAGRAAELGIPAVLVFGIPEGKDSQGSEAWSASGAVQRAVGAIKSACPDLCVMTDVCLCEYTDHGHCGLVEGGEVVNDASLELLARAAVSHAEAGADVVAPSDMMDGRVDAIRAAGRCWLHERGDPLLCRQLRLRLTGRSEAADSAPQFGDRRGYQMDPANRREALREVALDIQEGADMVMVKPALAYLDVLSDVAAESPVPVAAYNVSGEFAMVKAAAARGWIDERRVTMETLTAIKRAGADFILTYHALDAAQWLREGD